MQRLFLCFHHDFHRCLLDYLPRCIVANFLIKNTQVDNDLALNGLPLRDIYLYAFKSYDSINDYVEKLILNMTPVCIPTTMDEIEHGILRFLVPIAFRVNLQTLVI